jgi:hypothetical protein
MLIIAGVGTVADPFPNLLARRIDAQVSLA